MFAQTRLVIAIASALALSGCATDKLAMKNDGPLFFGAAQKPASAEGKGGGDKVTSKGNPKPVVFHGNDKLVRLPKKSEASVDKVAGDKVALNFEQVPLTDLVHSILGKLLHVDYSIDQPIKGEVTLHTGAPVARKQLLPILQSYLQANGALMVKGADGIYHIGPSDSMRALSSGVQSSHNIQPGYSTVIIPLKYIAATQMAKILKQVAPPKAFVLVDNNRNLLMLAGTKAQLDGWMQIIHSFDVDMLKGMSVGIFPIENGSVGEIAKAIDTLLSSGGKDGNALSGLVKVMPIKRLSSLLVVTPRAHYLDTIKTWINRLDRPPENDFEPTLYVYPVQNGSATHLAKLLNNLFGGGSGGGGGASSSAGEGSGVAPGLATSSISSSANGSTSGTASTFGSGSNSGSGSSMLNNSGSGTSSNGGGLSSNSMSSMLSGGGLKGGSSSDSQGGTSTVSLGDKVKVVADEENNALLIYARHKDYEKIAKALRSLDVSPTQVLIEASIIEVTLAGDLQYGLEWYLQGGLGNGYTGGATLNFNNSGEIAPQQPGFSYTISNSAGVVRAVLNALAKKSLVKVISSPSVMVLDNHTATIQVGDQQPVQSSQSIVTNGIVTNSITYKDTGVILSVTPSVNAGGLVRMKIQQAVTDVGSVDSATGQRSFLQRQIASQVAVRSGQTVVLGGLIKNNASQGKTGIPLLSDIPGLGSLFSTTTKSTNRTELLVMITPRVLRNQNDLGEITREMQERMTSLHTLPGWKKSTESKSAPDSEAKSKDKAGQKE